jgi:maltose/moltooligosaccharide transporter
MKGALPPVTQGRIIGLSAGYLGLQITFGIESASLSRVYQGFGAGIEDLALLWLAGPVSGLLVQPVIGRLSDRTWTRFGRRRPWMFGSGAIATAALTGIAFAPSLVWAIAMIWLLEISMNALNAPYRALVGDTLPEQQHGKGFAMQTVFIGVGAFLGALVPKVLSAAGLPNVVAQGATPVSVRLAFLAAATCLAISVLCTVFKVREYTKADYARFGIRLTDQRVIESKAGRASTDWLVNLLAYRRIAAMQFFAWAALYLLWVYATPVVARGTFAAISVDDPRYGDGADWVGVMFATYNGVAGLFAFILPGLFEKFSVSRVHAVALLAGSIGFAGVAMVGTPMLLLICAALIGIAYASMLSAPFVMASRIARQGQAGSAIGLMNVFIVVPQLVMGLGMGALVRVLLSGNPAGTLLIAGAFSLFAAIIAAGGAAQSAN